MVMLVVIPRASRRLHIPSAVGLLVGGIIQFLNDAKTTIVPKSYPGVQVSTIEPNARFALSNGRLVPAGEAEYSAMGPFEHAARTAATSGQNVANSGAH